MMQELDIRSFPLQGFHLIEASAGTGKTYTIASLYLRLIVEQRRSVENVLVVTFTQAATEELRDRIRARLQEALRAFESGASEDELLCALLADERDRAQAAQHLRDQITLMDQAAIYTIHGFCKRMLQEYAFESGALFDMEFVTSQTELLHAIVEDFWRQRFYPSSEARAAWIQSRWATPRDLREEVSGYLNKGELEILPPLPRGWEEEVERRFLETLGHCRDAWEAGREELLEILHHDKRLKRSEKTYRKDRVDGAVAAWELYLERPRMPRLPPLFELFTSGMIAASLRKNAAAPEHDFFGHCQTLSDLGARWQSAWRVEALGELMEFCRRELARRKQAQNVLSFDDLLTMLHHALRQEGGAALARGISIQYPLALIDEFQDTDALQYAIFRRIYHERPGCGLFVIGDPKQAIYSFRGADIFAYMRARHDTRAQDRHTLATNWRSTRAMVEAVNALFGGARSPFIYDEDIPFHETRASGRTDREVLRIDGRQPPALCVWHVPMNGENLHQGGIKKEWARAHLARGCALGIARLLGQAAAGAARIGDTPLAARDIAVLVRSGSQAAQIQAALRAVNVASAVISRESVFATGEAVELARLLAAVAEPAAERLIRAALCTELMGAGARELDALAGDEAGWERRLQQFQDYHGLWRQHGFMRMFHALLHDQDIPRRLLAHADGDRRLTNLLQLAELLQTASHQTHGMEGLLHWFADQRRETGGEDEERQLRLESDEALVKIVTIHKSKGLEYPVVFLPYLWDARSLKSDDPVLFHDEGQRLKMDLGSDDYHGHFRLAARELLAEELRLLYVAMTRAKYRCIVGWGKMKDAESSGLAYLLHPPRGPDDAPAIKDLDEAGVRAPWEALAQRHPEAIEISEVPAHAEPPSAVIGAGDEAAARVFRGHIERDWQISSFTALSSGRARARDVDHDAEPPVAAGADEVPAGIFAFPRGAQAGVFFHALFERLDFPHARGEPLREEIARQLLRHGYDQQWLPVIEEMAARALDTPLDEGGALRLRDIDRANKLVELEFLYPLAPLSPERLDGLLRRFAEYESDVPALNFKPARGMMTGFIDLLVGHGGRFHIVDYKSNHLGDRREDYAPEGLAREMRAQRYDLQYLIYSVALHRYLARRIADYDFERHFGGVYYLFLRGMDGRGGGVWRGRPEKALIEALDRLFSGRSGGGA